jgi:hypothetical protein
MVSLREHNERRENTQAARPICGMERPSPWFPTPERPVCPTRPAPGPIGSRGGNYRQSNPGTQRVMAALRLRESRAMEFVFMGFIPRSGALRTRWLEALATSHARLSSLRLPIELNDCSRRWSIIGR